MQKYHNRQDAGSKLADALQDYANRDDVIVLALPRGGVPVAYEVARALHAPLDLYIVRKLGVPGHAELAMGAIASGGAFVYNEDIIESLQISQSEINAVIERETKELQRRERVYRGNQPFPSLESKTVILVDDGIATGATVRAAIKALRQQHPAKIIAAVPVADQSIEHKIKALADLVVCPMLVRELIAVGAWYDDFSQTEDEEVFAIMEAAKKIN